MVTLVDPRRLVPRTDVVLTGPRLTAAQRRPGRERVLAAVRAGVRAVPPENPEQPARAVIAAAGRPDRA